jgi:hypothetical protein
MSGLPMRRELAVFAVALIAGISACSRSAPASAHVSLSSIDPIRAAFNSDSGKVRAIFLASPT